MAEIVLVRQETAPITKADADAARRVLFGQIDGLSEAHRKSWRSLWNFLLKRAEPGEMVEIKTHRERIGVYHRKHMLMEQRVFNSQERFDDFRQFRIWLKVGAAFVDWIPGPKGGVIPVARSIAYAELEQGDMERLHADMIVFLRTAHAQKTLWPHVTAGMRSEIVEQLVEGFDHG